MPFLEIILSIIFGAVSLASFIVGEETPDLSVDRSAQDYQDGVQRDQENYYQYCREIGL